MPSGTKGKQERSAQIQAVADLQASIGKANWRQALWRCIQLYQGTAFQTAGRGKERRGAVSFTYRIKLSNRTGRRTDELLISTRKLSKTITRSTVELAFQNALAEQEAAGCVSGPKRLKVFGASYLYSIFLHWGCIKARQDSADANAEG